MSTKSVSRSINWQTGDKLGLNRKHLERSIQGCVHLLVPIVCHLPPAASLNANLPSSAPGYLVRNPVSAHQLSPLNDRGERLVRAAVAAAAAKSKSFSPANVKWEQVGTGGSWCRCRLWWGRELIRLRSFPRTHPNGAV